MTAINGDFKDLVKSRISLSDVVSEFTTLQRRGRRVSGCCPFHKEKTPSFYVYEDEGHYHCYGCKAHGDVFDILMEKKGYSFVEALSYLCDKAGLEMPRQKTKEELNIEERLYDLLSFTASFYRRHLFSDQGRRALDYCRTQRQLSEKTIDRFGLGYAPTGQMLQKELRNQNFSNQDALDAGVLKKGQYGIYDPMQGRLVFPIADLFGKIIGFGGRLLEKNDRQAKYLNTGETHLFKKNQILYGGQTLKRDRQDRLPILCVEGYMDVIALRQAGYKRAVATLGTALGESHLRLLWAQNGRNAKMNPTVCFDGDAAGHDSAQRVLVLLLPLMTTEQTVDFMNLSQSKDPDDVIRMQGFDVFTKIVDTRLSAFDFFYNSFFGQSHPKTPEEKAKLRAKADHLLGKIQDKTLMWEWKRNLNQLFSQAWYAPKKLSMQGQLSLSDNSIIMGDIKRSTLDHYATALQRKVVNIFRVVPRLCDVFCVQELQSAVLDPEMLNQLHDLYERFFSTNTESDQCPLSAESFDHIVDALKRLLDCLNEHQEYIRGLKLLSEGNLNVSLSLQGKSEKNFRLRINALMSEIETYMQN